ncbi:MAG: XRE family transcriptional regulator [Sphingobacterium sp.]|uniref:XRE family transcriptional regulator n=1 Tax=Sphingobacterium sp. JB170 TaxID=1434842 RepID=UPI00097EECDD|nr:LexA family transcriptional regulator [Sphingobacterium sp. JB170]SJN15644.1 transcriptional regulator [Sphingobacterium sp. JB170]
MSNFGTNLKFLRKQKRLSQQALSDELGVKRPSIGAYEELRAEPNFDMLKKMADFFEISMDEFTQEVIDADWKPKARNGNSGFRVLSITVDPEEKQNIEFVPVKASAGYTNGYGDPEYVSSLQKFSLPMFNQGTYRAFEIKGDSMLPLESGTMIITEYVEDWKAMKANDTYVIITNSEGIVYKRLGQKYNESKGVKLVSDNPSFSPYWVEPQDILEIWKAKAFISKDFPVPNSTPTLETLSSMMAQMQKTIVEVVNNK